MKPARVLPLSQTSARLLGEHKMTPRSFSKLLVANRGEIACRIIRTARSLGYVTVAITSEADRNARHANMADESVLIGAAPVAESYLNAQRILDAAQRSGADAVHPGYGFLSENAEFAASCEAAGLLFIGPSPDAIRAMGDKAAAKRRMIAAGVRCVPGYQGDDQDDARLAAEAALIGYPVMIKAVAGGGGRGMRRVDGPAAFAAALASARSEARNAFGDGTVLLERAIIEPRHVEIQVFGDHHGKVIHLGERDCSVQRRHQKVIEEAPSPAVDPALRLAMGAAAVAAAQAIGYVGAGTVEFLLGSDREFYFLEMNTRLQVEHPVTEMITGLDLVAMQLGVAAGKPLPVAQGDVAFTGHAIETRLYAEDPYQGFLPQSGMVELWRPATAEGVRIDHGVVAGTAIPSHYDAMVAKIIAWGTDRHEALRRLERAVRDTVLLGPQTNKSFVLSMLNADAFRGAEATTAFIDQLFPGGPVRPAAPLVMQALAAVLAVGEVGWRSNRWLAVPVTLSAGAATTAWSVQRDGERYLVTSKFGAIEIESLTKGPDQVRWSCKGCRQCATYVIRGDEILIDDGSGAWRFSDQVALKRTAREVGNDGTVRAPITGTVAAVLVALGDRVVRGQTLMILEAMKMEHQIMAPVDGVVETLVVVSRQQVGARDIMIVVTADVAAA